MTGIEEQENQDGIKQIFFEEKEGKGQWKDNSDGQTEKIGGNRIEQQCLTSC